MKEFKVLIIILIIAAASGCVDKSTKIVKPTDAIATTNNQTEELTLHVIDVGQGDALLLDYGDHDMLIDAGEIGDGDIVENYLKSQGVTSLDYLVITHPHSDHIGGVPVILKDLPVKCFVYNGETHTTKTYENILTTVLQDNISAKKVHRGDKLDFASGIDITVLNPPETFLTTDEINQNSIVLKVTDGKVSFLLEGDAGTEAESSMLTDHEDLSAYVLKVGHHGSRTATSNAFVDAVKPIVSIVSVGKDNKYGLPDEEPISALKSSSKLYRTDYNGTVIVSTNGNVCNVASAT
jgi:competence protein ComEC